MNRLYSGFSCGVIALGVLHIVAASRTYETLTQAALWFVSGGITMILTGALNLLNRVYGRAATGLRGVCIATNVVMTAFALVAGVIGHASAVQLIVVVGLFGGTSILAFVPSALSARGAA